jgi:hypothetical protein
VSEPIVPEQSAFPPVDPPRRHPVRIVNNDDLKRSRLTVAFRLLLAIPHLLWLTLYTLAAIFMGIVNWFATLVKGQSPQAIHNWFVRYLRYSIYVNAYLYLLANPYPPFHGTEGSYPIDLEVDGPDSQRRLVTFFRPLMAIPAWILNWVFGQVLQIVAFLAWFVVIIVGRMPHGMQGLGLYCLRYKAQTNAYVSIVTDRYPSLTA